MTSTSRFVARGHVITKNGTAFLEAITPEAAQATAIMLNKGYISPRAYADGEFELIEREIHG